MMPQHHNTVTLELALTRRFPCFDILYYTSRVYCGSLLCHNCIVHIYGSMGHLPYIHHHFFHLIINQCTCLIFSCNEDANAVISIMDLWFIVPTMLNGTLMQVYFSCQQICFAAIQCSPCLLNMYTGS